MDRHPISGNVPAEVAERLSDKPSDPQVFDEWDDDHLGAVCPYELKEAIGDLLQARWQIERAEVFEAIDKSRAYDLVRPALDKLLKGCDEIWRAL